MFALGLWRNGLRNVYFLIASIENQPFDLVIHEIKISARPAPEAWGLAEKEWPSPPTYEPPHQLTNLDGMIFYHVKKCSTQFWPKSSNYSCTLLFPSPVFCCISTSSAWGRKRRSWGRNLTLTTSPTRQTARPSFPFSSRMLTVSSYPSVSLLYLDCISFNDQLFFYIYRTGVHTVAVNALFNNKISGLHFLFFRFKVSFRNEFRYSKILKERVT